MNRRESARGTSRAAECAAAPPADPALAIARVVAAWPAMPDAIRAAVVALAAPYAPEDTAGITAAVMNAPTPVAPTPKPVAPPGRRRPSPRQRPRWRAPLTPAGSPRPAAAG